MPDTREQIIDKVLNNIYIDNLPEDVTINTMTITCETNIKFETEHLTNIAKYFDLDKNGIIKISHGKSGDYKTNRSIIHKKKIKKVKKNKKVFFNQVSLCVVVESKKEKPVNLKMFSNGSIQMTGCKTIENALDAIERVFFEMRKVKAIFDPKQKKIVEQPFCMNSSCLNLDSIKNMKVEMIVSKFTYPRKINRYNLFDKLNTDMIECKFDPELHASVDLKIDCEDKKISVFIFEKGSIVITGARTCKHIEHAYNFVNEYLLRNHSLISRVNAGQDVIEQFL